MKLILVRHGETDDNKNRRSGNLETSLNEKGFEQAKKIGARLKNYSFDKVIVSPLKRTRQTAKEILKFHSIKPEYEERIVEVNRGIFQGLPSKEFWERAKDSGNVITYKPPNGESIEELRIRTRNYFEDLIEKEKGKTILVVSHGGVITNALLHLLKKHLDEFKNYLPENTALTILQIKDDEKHEIQKLNCVKHL